MSWKSPNNEAGGTWYRGYLDPMGAAFPEWIIQQAMTRDAVALPEEKTGSPTFCEDLTGISGVAARSWVATRLPESSISANSGSCTWRRVGASFVWMRRSRTGLDIKAKRIGGNRLEDVAAFSARRPANSVLPRRGSPV
jgi:dTDP-4-dehydrorhamnose reductase